MTQPGRGSDGSVPSPRVPDDPLSFIYRCIRRRNVRWTYHVNMRLQGRFISRHMILASVDAFEVIEEYPQDKYLPSYLVFSEYEGSKFHVLIAVDEQEDNVRMITAYYPNLLEWEEDLKTRRTTA